MDARDRRLRNLYGITSKEYDLLLRKQNGVCWICQKPPKNIRLSVDHEHQKDEKKIRKKKEQYKIRSHVRGLLCWNCNRGIRVFRDNVQALYRASRYVHEHPAQEILYG